jgi:hypothetical protein
MEMENNQFETIKRKKLRSFVVLASDISYDKHKFLLR